MKYIDAERLKAKLDEHYRKYQSKYMETRTPYTQGLIDALDLAEQVIDSLQKEQTPLPSELDEAAEKKYPVYWKDYPKDGIARSELSYDTNKQCRDAFKAGAEWQYQKDRGKFAKIKAKTWCEGFDAHKEQMLKDTVDLDADIEMEWDSFNKHLAEYDKESEEVVWLNWLSFVDIANYFYNLGRNARKED